MSGMNSYRGGYQIGDTVELRAVFCDVNGEFISADVDPTVYIYDQSVDDEVREAEVEAGTFTSAIASIAATELSTGYYSASYTVATQEGLVYEFWSATVDGASQVTRFYWTATAGAVVKNQQPGDNSMVIIDINGILDLDGNTIEEQLFYTTKYDPLYASPDLVRLELGPWIDYIPDDTMALMLHWSSKEADFIQAQPGCDKQRLKFARAKFVVYDAALKAMLTPGHGASADGALDSGKKALGDLSIQMNRKDGTAATQETVDWLKSERDKWWKVMQAGACINPGQSFNPTFAVKGIHDPDRRLSGRLWEDPREFNYASPAVNEKRRRAGRRRGRFGLYPRQTYPYSTTKFTGE